MHSFIFINIYKEPLCKFLELFLYIVCLYPILFSTSSRYHLYFSIPNLCLLELSLSLCVSWPQAWWESMARHGCKQTEHHLWKQRGQIQGNKVFHLSWLCQATTGEPHSLLVRVTHANCRSWCGRLSQKQVYCRSAASRNQMCTWRGGGYLGK